jgi:heme-degrading monooxygenase HmoA
MHVRVSTFEGSPDQIDAGIELGRTQVLPACQQLNGFEGLLMLVDRTSGKSIALTFWESEEALRRSEDAANRIRKDSSDQAGETIANVERYEVGLDAITRVAVEA